MPLQFFLVLMFDEFDGLFLAVCVFLLDFGRGFEGPYEAVSTQGRKSCTMFFSVRWCLDKPQALIKGPKACQEILVVTTEDCVSKFS